jgi:hypothetical protein
MGKSTTTGIEGTTIEKQMIFNILDSGTIEYKPVKEKIVNCSDCFECCRFFKIPLSPYECTWIEHEETDGIIHIKKKPDGSCIYLKDGKCSIYDKRPMACREYSCKHDWRIMHSDHDDRPRRNILEDDFK